MCIRHSIDPSQRRRAGAVRARGEESSDIGAPGPDRAAPGDRGRRSDTRDPGRAANARRRVASSAGRTATLDRILNVDLPIRGRADRRRTIRAKEHVVLTSGEIETSRLAQEDVVSTVQHPLASALPDYYILIRRGAVRAIIVKTGKGRANDDILLRREVELRARIHIEHGSPDHQVARAVDRHRIAGPQIQVSDGGNSLKFDGKQIDGPAESGWRSQSEDDIPRIVRPD